MSRRGGPVVVITNLQSVRHGGGCVIVSICTIVVHGNQLPYRRIVLMVGVGLPRPIVVGLPRRLPCEGLRLREGGGLAGHLLHSRAAANFGFGFGFGSGLFPALAPALALALGLAGFVLALKADASVRVKG